MLPICIALVIVTTSGTTLPLARIVGAAIVTFAIWHGENKNCQLKELEERIALLETMVNTPGFR